MRAVHRVLALALPCALALAGCNDHRFGFFPGTESDGSSSIGVTETTTLGPTTPSPTTVQPTTVQSTTVTSPTTDGPTTITSDPTATVTSDPTATSGDVECGQISLGASVPADFFGTLKGQGDGFSVSCGGSGGSDIGVLWTPPFTGRFAFDTSGSNFDSVVAVIEGICFGTELACDDDSGDNLNSRVELDLVAGQTVTVVVESFTQNFGEIELRISEVVQDDCPDTVFEQELPIVMPGQTTGAPNVRSSDCGGSDSPEIEALWVPPFDGVFRFEVTESDFDPVMYLRADGCNGPELLCNDDNIGLNPGFETLLVGGQPVVIVIDGLGSSGSFTLLISEG